jgi:cephalosporin-C deacetylase
MNGQARPADGMALFDLPLDELQRYRPARDEAPDFDAFWEATIGSARGTSAAPVFTPFEAGLTTVDTWDVTFSGYGGQPIRGWFLAPRDRTGRLPVVVQYLGYGDGRGTIYDRLLWSAAGYAHLVMDTRGQGSQGAQAGATADAEPDGSSPSAPGFLTRGIFDPASHFYRRVFADAVLAIDAARTHPAVDPERVIVFGGSQGGGIALAATGLAAGLAAALVDVPFLCHYRRAIELTEENPYGELARYLRIHRTRTDAIFRTLSYVDGVNHAARASAPALFSVGLMDTICPPSTVYAAYNHYGGPKEMSVWPYAGHEGGGSDLHVRRLAFLEGLGLRP